MKFTPNHPIIYKGVLRKTGVTFTADDADFDELIRHGAAELRTKPPPVNKAVKKK